MLNKQQKQQVEKQLQGHRHSDYKTEIVLDDNHKLTGFLVTKNVLKPEQMAAIYLARFLFSNDGLYANKRVLDMGCGTGLQGIVTGIYGAEHVDFADISEDAAVNTKINLKEFNLEKKARVYLSDLFENVSGRYDLVIFNHPFFPDKPRKSEPVSVAMLDEGKLIRRFLKLLPEFMSDDGVCIMPYYDLAGETNDPIIAKRYGFNVSRNLVVKNNDGLQKGDIIIYTLRK